MPPFAPAAIRGRPVPAVAFGLLLLLLAGCGRRGPLEPPPDASAPPSRRATVRTTNVPSATTLATQPGAVVTDAPDDEVEDAPAVTVNPQPTPGRRGRAYVVPKEPFLLDPLL